MSTPTPDSTASVYGPPDPATASSVQVSTAQKSTPATLPNTLDALQEQQPEFYKLMMQTSFITFMKQNNASQDRIHKMNQEQYSAG